MAPGVGGNGGGGGSRPTGTVPKTKSHNESSREYNGTSRRDHQHLRNMPNNLSSLEWQPVYEPVSHVRTRKESNTSASRFSETFDPGEENIVTQDNNWYNSASQRGQIYYSDDEEGGWVENKCKSNNLELEDKTQVATRLHQIRDYVNQTVDMMDTLKASGGQTNMIQHEKLASMLEGLRDSEVKMLRLYERLQNHPEGLIENIQNHQVETPRERDNHSSSGVPKSSESAQRNELKKRVQVTELKLQELQEQQNALKALRQKAQDQLNEARAAQAAILSAHGVNQQLANADSSVQDRLHHLQRFFDTRDQLVQLVGLEDGEVESSEMQNKLDELQAKKHHMDQLLAQISHLNGTDDMTAEECEKDVENKMAELNSMRETLALLQGSIPAHKQARVAQARPIVTESRSTAEKCNTTSNTGHSIQAKTYQLQEAKSKLQQLQTLLHTVEELRESGQPIPESILQRMTEHTHRSDASSQDLNISAPVSDAASERSFRRERANQHQPANAAKHNNMDGKLGMKVQLEELLRSQDIILPHALQSSSVQENSVTTGTWGGSTQGLLDDSYNPDFHGEVAESSSVKNVTIGPQPHNSWRRKPSTGSGMSHGSWTSPSVVQANEPDHPPPSTLPPPPDSQWVVQQITQLQSQLQQMSNLYKNFVEKQHNCAPPTPWIPATNMSHALGPYCHYLASASQWQQQQLLVHSLNQCCQLIWHQQRELTALKEALRLLQQPPRELSDLPPPVEHTACSSNLTRRPLKPSLSSGPSLVPPTVVSSAHSLPNLTSAQTSPISPTPINTTSLPPSLNNTQPNPNVFFNHNSQFTDSTFANLYPPYGNNLNFEFPSPVNFFPHPPEPFLSWSNISPQAPPPTTLNNQVPPGNRANNYWDNFRSYSRQNLLSTSGKSNDGLPQRTPFERFLNTDHTRVRKEQVNTHSRQVSDPDRVVHSQVESDGEIANGFQHEASGPMYEAKLQQHMVPPPRFQHNEIDLRSSGRFSHENEPRVVHSARFLNENEVQAPHSTIHENETLRSGRENETRTSKLQVNDSEKKCSQSSRSINGNDTKMLHSNRVISDKDAKSQHLSRLLNESESKSLLVINSEGLRGANKKSFTQELPRSCNRKGSIIKRTYCQAVKVSQQEGNTEADCGTPAVNLVSPENIGRTRRTHRNVNQISDIHSLGASDKGVRRKENKANLTKESKTETKSVEECVYSEVAALISANESRPQFLLQLLKDLRRLSGTRDPATQATLSSLHLLASAKEELPATEINNAQLPADSPSDNCSQQPRNWPAKDQALQLPLSCSNLDWEVRAMLADLLPFIKGQLGEVCGPHLSEALRRLVVQLVPSQATLNELDAQLEDALQKFHGSRLADVYEELITVLADVLTCELTFLRFVNTVHQPTEEHDAAKEVENDEEEGAVGGIGLATPTPLIHPANQPRRIKVEKVSVSEADLAEADQSRHSNSGGEEDRAGLQQPEEEEASVREVSVASCSSNRHPDPQNQVNWAVEQDRELGLDQVPTRLATAEAESEANTGASENGLI